MTEAQRHAISDTDIRLYTDKLTWANARKVCQGWGGDLADIESPEVHERVAEHFGSSTGAGWTGAVRDENVKDEWNWAASTRSVNIAVPKGGRDAGDCAVVHANMADGMTAASCEDKHEFICRRPSHIVHKYAFSTKKASWADAKRACEADGYRLASVRNAEEQGKLRRMINRTEAPVWIGGSNTEGGAEGDSGNWQWTDGTPFGYTHWHCHQPNNWKGKEHCAAIWQGDMWNDWVCEQKA